MPSVLPVIDLLNGQVVRGVAGRRTEYRPINSSLIDSSEPLAIANAIRRQFGLSRFYLADLNGIIFHQPDFDLYKRLADCEIDCVIDAGIRDHHDAENVMKAGASGIILGLESCRSPEDLAGLIQVFPDAIFSLDLQQGHPNLRQDAYGWDQTAQAIIQQAVDSKIANLLILDLMDVGMGTGGSTDSLCEFTHRRFPQIRKISGGGVRGVGDLIRMFQRGVDEVLIASALHDHAITREELIRCCHDAMSLSSKH